eukprot:CAMPEP_0168240308 /NCGR_PEP_ID=MMETSP0140_2-20121125/22090_1 /TAXON_ID=44445 /ORGANISM="Pseudo-nitzschia australis, Strain 10249 10 AB" /LENGTH=80 /DNA_ID=CAMNT_0008174879 /DNA_START=828 /DNA_END=1067 /DNA_ORIENTATION=+
MGVPIAGSTSVYRDNESIVKNVARPESPCKKKKHNGVACPHKATREAISRLKSHVLQKSQEAQRQLIGFAHKINGWAYKW